MTELRDLVVQDMAKLGHVDTEDIRKVVGIARNTLDKLFIHNTCSNTTIRKISIVTKRPIREYEACEFKLV